MRKGIENLSWLCKGKNVACIGHQMGMVSFEGFLHAGYFYLIVSNPDV